MSQTLIKRIPEDECIQWCWQATCVGVCLLGIWLPKCAKCVVFLTAAGRWCLKFLYMWQKLINSGRDGGWKASVKRNGPWQSMRRMDILSGQLQIQQRCDPVITRRVQSQNHAVPCQSRSVQRGDQQVLSQTPVRFLFLSWSSCNISYKYLLNTLLVKEIHGCILSIMGVHARHLHYPWRCITIWSLKRCINKVTSSQQHVKWGKF